MEITEQEAYAMQDNVRKLVSIRTISGLYPIEGKDLIETAQVDGWKIVVKKNQFKIGDLCVYFEVDSFLPEGNPAWQFLIDKSPKIMDGVKGHKLRSIKLGGQLSQGLVLSIHDLADTVVVIHEHEYEFGDVVWEIGENVTDLLGVKKFEAPLPANLVGQAAGLFPSFIRKTDQERAQNLKQEIFGYDEARSEFDYSKLTQDVLDAGIAAGRMIQEDDGSYKLLHKAKASREDTYEISLKLDGSSMTSYGRKTEQGIETGVCSRNLELKVNEENSGNSFVSMFVGTGLQAAIEKYVQETGNSIAVQAELMGPGIQGNREGFKEPKLFVFDIYSIDHGVYCAPKGRIEILKKLQEYGAKIDHAPILHTGVKLQDLGLIDVDKLLEFAEGPSINHAVREGLVYKRMDGGFSFKTISNKFLLKEKE